MDQSRPPSSLRRRNIGSRSSGDGSVMSYPSGGAPQASSVAAAASRSENYSVNPDNLSYLDQVVAFLVQSNLDGLKLILGIDFTIRNEWTGKVSFNNQSLHAIGEMPNPYENAISVIGRTLAPFDEHNMIPSFGFGDVTTHDSEVFSFHDDHSPCHGFEEVLTCYKNIVPNLQLSGPTSYAPVIEAAIDIVEKSGGQYHALVIIANSQVTRSVNTGDKELSPQEEKTINSIVAASAYPLSIVLVGLGDGPWDDMGKFRDKIPARGFDNFKFVNFTEIMSKNGSRSEKEAAFALAALMDIPIHYKAIIQSGILGRVTGKAKRAYPRPPPPPYADTAPPPSSHQLSNTRDEGNGPCPICLTTIVRDLAFGCGHMTCRECGYKVHNCPICREPIKNRLRLYPG